MIEHQSIHMPLLCQGHNLTGPFPDPKISCIYDLSHLNRRHLEQGQICYVNGIQTTFIRARGICHLFSDLSGGINITGIYNPCSFALWDAVKSVAFYQGYVTLVEKHIATVWENFFERSKSGLLLHICASQGAIFTNNALKRLYAKRPEQAKRICIVSLSPAKHIDPALCRWVRTLQTWVDIVSKLDLPGLIRHQDSILPLKRHPYSTSAIDHSPNGLSYMGQLQELFLKYFLDSKVIASNINIPSSIPLDDPDSAGMLCYQVWHGPEGPRVELIRLQRKHHGCGPEVPNIFFELPLSDLQWIDHAMDASKGFYQSIFGLCIAFKDPLWAKFALAGINFASACCQVALLKTHADSSYKPTRLRSLILRCTGPLFMAQFASSIYWFYLQFCIKHPLPLASGIRFSLLMTPTIASSVTESAFALTPTIQTAFFSLVHQRVHQPKNQEFGLVERNNLDALLIVEGERLKRTILSGVSYALEAVALVALLYIDFNGTRKDDTKRSDGFKWEEAAFSILTGSYLGYVTGVCGFKCYKVYKRLFKRPPPQRKQLPEI